MLTMYQYSLMAVRERKYCERSLALLNRTWSERNESDFRDALATIDSDMRRWPIQLDDNVPTAESMLSRPVRL